VARHQHCGNANREAEGIQTQITERQTAMSEIQIHSAAELFPMMSDSEFKELKESIREYGGNREPNTFWNGHFLTMGQISADRKSNSKNATRRC